MGTLYYGDNLDILRRHLKGESVDLVHLDPPLRSQSEVTRLTRAGLLRLDVNL